MHRCHDLGVNMRKITVLCLLLILALGGAACAEDAAVRVNGRVFTVEEVQNYINETAANMRIIMGIDVSDVYDADARKEFLQEAAEHFVTVEVMNEQLRAQNRFALSKEEEASLREFAQTKYDEIWVQLNDRVGEAYPDMEDRETYVSQLVESAGYSMDGIFEQAVQALREQRLIELYCADITVDDAETNAFYEENVVAPDREKYAEDLHRFESEVLLGGGTSAYMPEGYFYIKYIVLAPKESSADAIADAQTAAAESAQKREEAYDALAAGALENGDLDALRAAYSAAEDVENAALDALNAAVEAAEKDYAPIWQVVCDALDAGETFEDQMQKYSIETDMSQEIDKGYPFHADSVIWDAHLREAVRTLAAKGEITKPIYANGHVYIVCRMADIPSGAYPLSDAERDELKEGLLRDRQTERLDELAREWREDADVEVDISGLEFPVN